MLVLDYDSRMAKAVAAESPSICAAGAAFDILVGLNRLIGSSELSPALMMLLGVSHLRSGKLFVSLPSPATSVIVWNHFNFPTYTPPSGR